LDVDSTIEASKTRYSYYASRRRSYIGSTATNGAKAFSYFQTIVKRWLINYNNKNYKKLKQVGSFEEMEDSYEVVIIPGF
jgi:hypothetical protein